MFWFSVGICRPFSTDALSCSGPHGGSAASFPAVGASIAPAAIPLPRPISATKTGRIFFIFSASEREDDVSNLLTIARLLNIRDLAAAAIGYAG